MEKLLDYRQDQVHQDTIYNCGSASVQTIIRAATDRPIPEADLGRELGTQGRHQLWSSSHRY